MKVKEKKVQKLFTAAYPEKNNQTIFGSILKRASRYFGFFDT